MKQKSYFMLAVAAALLTACSSNDLSESPATAPQLDDSAVNFSAYVNRGVTRAGAAGTLTTSNAEAPNVSLQAVGFGVFAYYSDSESFSETSKPNFMYNQKVSGENWTYSPLKYWPNEFGKNASSEGQDRLTFFAYAPYVNANPSTGRIIKGENDGDNGIVAMTSNTASGDPYIKYYADMDPDLRVDLCWGVAKEEFTASVDEEALNEVAAGEPYIDVVKPATGSLINFDFKHALAAVNVQIDTDINTEGHSDNSAEVDRYTRIWVRSVTFEGFTDKGRLNLNSKAADGPQWFDLTNDSPVASGVVSVYDGRTDGKEGRENATAKKENPATLNAKIVQGAPYSQADLKAENEADRKLTISDAVPGVTKTTVNLFDALAAEAPVYVIPTDENLKVTIVYDVETYDPSLAAFLSDGAVRGSSVQNTIEKEIVFQDGTENVTKLEAGKVYTIKLHLGLTSVKFDASVTDWAEGYGTGVDLPYNTADGHYTEAGAAAHNAGLDGAVHAGDEYDPVQYYTPEEIAAHNATLDIWEAPKVKTAEVLYTDAEIEEHNATLDIWAAPKVKTAEVLYTDAEIEEHNAALDIWVAPKVKTPAVPAQDAVLYANAEEYNADKGTNLNDEEFAALPDDEKIKTPAVPAQEAVYYTDAEIEEHNSALDIWTAPKVETEAVYYTDAEIEEHNAALDIWTAPKVKTEAVYYTDAEIEEHNAELDIWTAETHRKYTQEEADAYNATLPGAVHAGDPVQ